MYKICKTEKSIQRQKLFQTTLLSMMEKQQYHDITVTALTKEMGIPRKTFYRYYDVLEDVLYAIIDDAIIRSFLNLEVRADIEGFFIYWNKNKYILDVLEMNGLSTLLINRVYEKFNTGILVENTDEEGVTDKELKYAGYIAAIMTMLISWHHTGMKQSPKEMHRIVQEMFQSD